MRVNPDTLSWQRVGHPHWEGVLRGLVQAHVRETSSRYAAQMLLDWARDAAAVLAGGAEGIREISAGAARRPGGAAGLVAACCWRGGGWVP